MKSRSDGEKINTPFDVPLFVLQGKADMFAAGCVLLELVTCSRLQGPLWDDGPEVRAQREAKIAQVRFHLTH